MAKRKIHVLLIEDEDFDVRRVKKTLQPFENRIKIIEVVSNGKRAVELIESDTIRIDVIIMDFQIAGGLMGRISFAASRP